MRRRQQPSRCDVASSSFGIYLNFPSSSSKFRPVWKGKKHRCDQGFPPVFILKQRLARSRSQSRNRHIPIDPQNRAKPLLSSSFSFFCPSYFYHRGMSFGTWEEKSLAASPTLIFRPTFARLVTALKLMRDCLPERPTEVSAR